VIATMQPTLMTGPYDWHEEIAPRADFDARIAAVWAIARAAGADVVLVHGDRIEFSALAWLTHFTPKLGPALALFPPDAEPVLLFSGGPGMIGSAQRLSWIENMRVLGNPARELAALGGKRVALVGEVALTRGLHTVMAQAVGDDGSLIRIDAEVAVLRRSKSAREQAAMRVAADALGAFSAAFAARLHHGDSLAAAKIAAERAAYAAGAQDVRVGPERAQVHVAVRAQLYWAQGWLTRSAPRAAVGPVSLPGLLAKLRPGVMVPAIDGVWIAGMGMSLEEAPGLGDVLRVGDVVSVRLPAASAIALISDAGAVLLWSSQD
jgi:hypothetical protein